jgi:hypothetical protein
MRPPPRHFTLAEANRTLPYLRRIADDLVAAHARWLAAVAEYEVHAGRADAAGTAHAEVAARAAAVQALAAEVEGYVREIEAVGAVVKGIELGLVDFPGTLDGKPIFWCWRAGEPAIEHWHDRDAGFAGRQPVPVFTAPEER